MNMPPMRSLWIRVILKGRHRCSWKRNLTWHPCESHTVNDRIFESYHYNVQVAEANFSVDAAHLAHQHKAKHTNFFDSIGSTISLILCGSRHEHATIYGYNKAMCQLHVYAC